MFTRLFLACEQAPGEDRKKNFGKRKTEEFGERRDRGGSSGACSQASLFRSYQTSITYKYFLSRLY